MRYEAQESFRYDALANLMSTTTGATTKDWTNGFLSGGSEANWSLTKSYKYAPGVERHTSTVYQPGTVTQRDTLTYDAAGNNVWVSAFGGYGDERASFYAADGRTAAADYRSLSPPSGQWGISSWRTSFEEYRYDAFGRRVWVRARNACMGTNPLCALSKVRRIVWDGHEELYEIQMPGADSDTVWLENDTNQVDLDVIWDQVAYDPNTQFGRVSYTPGVFVDQPLSVVRFGYRSELVSDSGTVATSPLVLPPFAITPLWSPKGQADLGVFEDGSLDKCTLVDGVTRCVWRDWPAEVWAYQRSATRRNAWHGSVLEDKRDDAGTLYRRNRYYDPSTGRFTQEDPIGLAGGINLYGFAAGDPVSYSDPFGLAAQPACEPFCTGVDLTLLAADVRDIRQNGLGWGNGIGAGLGLLSVLTPFMTGLGAADDLARTASKYEDITRRSRGRARFWNRATDVGADQFVDNLVESGFTRSVTDDGVQVLTRGKSKYSVRGPELSKTGGWTADVYTDGELIGKIRLGERR